MRLLPSLLALPFAVACIAQPTSAALVQQTAHEFNTNTRFGRNEIAGESVAPSFREAYNRTHSGWGKDLRIGDTEMSGVKLEGKDKDEATVGVRISWYRVSEGDLHETSLRQKWRLRGTAWMLEGEERESGELGLLGEKVEAPAAASARPRAQFPTVRIGTQDGT